MNDLWIKYYDDGKLDSQYTHEEADRIIDLIKQKFIREGIMGGDRIVVRKKNSPQTIFIYLALTEIGAIVVPVHPNESQYRLDYIVNHCRAKAIISDKNEDVEIITGGDSKTKYNRSELSLINTIIYTSGTTGTSKGVCLSIDNWLANSKSLIEHHNLTNKIVLASPLPLFHCNAYGLSMFTTRVSRCKLILFNKVTDNFLDIISKEKVNIVSLVPSILKYIFNKKPDWKPYKELKYILTAAAPLGSNLIKTIFSQWGARIIQGYGLSESTNFSCTLPVGLSQAQYDKIMFPHPSIGVPLTNVNIEINGKMGELVIESPSNCLGYWGEDISGQNKIFTGDIGYSKIFDNKKYYYLVGRKKELINRGGEKFSPLEIELELENYGLKGDYAIISIPDDIFGEEVGLASTGVTDFSVINSIPKNRRPKKIFIVDAIPKTITGKIKRKKLADLCLIGFVKQTIKNTNNL